MPACGTTSGHRRPKEPARGRAGPGTRCARGADSEGRRGQPPRTFPCLGRAPAAAAAPAHPPPAHRRAVPPLRSAVSQPPRRHYRAIPPRRPSAALYGSAAVSRGPVRRRARTEEVTERRRRRRGRGSGSSSSSSMWRVLARRVARGAAGAPGLVRSRRALGTAGAGRGAAAGVGAVPLGLGPAWGSPVHRPGGLLPPPAWPRLVPRRCCSLPAHQKVRGSPIPGSLGAPHAPWVRGPGATGVRRRTGSCPPRCLGGGPFAFSSRASLPLPGQLTLLRGTAVLSPLPWFSHLCHHPAPSPCTVIGCHLLHYWSFSFLLLLVPWHSFSFSQSAPSQHPSIGLLGRLTSRMEAVLTCWGFADGLSVVSAHTHTPRPSLC